MRMLPIAESECATLIRQIYSQRQLYELMVDFWHDHFSVFGWDYDGGPMFVAMDRDAIRPNVFGNFRTMLQAVGESASMMYMLDLYASAGRPSERELRARADGAAHARRRELRRHHPRSRQLRRT